MRAKRTRLVPGVILAFPLGDSRFGYAQYLHSGRGLIYKMLDMIGVFDFFSTEELSAEILAGKPWLFPPVFVGVRPALARGEWKIIGKIPLQPFEMPTFRFNQGGAWRPGIYHNWYLIFPSHEF